MDETVKQPAAPVVAVPREKIVQKAATVTEVKETQVNTTNNLSANALIVREALESYKAIFVKKNKAGDEELVKVVSPAAMRQAIRLLQRVVLNIVNQARPDVMTEFYNFHVAEKDRLMTERYGLRGIETLEDNGDRDVVSVIYSLFRLKLDSKPFKPSYETLSTVLGRYGTLDQIVDFLNKKK